MLRCKICTSTHVKKNGVTAAGRQKYHCKACGIYTTTDDAARERAAKEELVEQLHLERVSQRGIARVTGMSRSTIIKRLKKKTFAPISAALTPSPLRPVLEMDELWSYVDSKGNQVWVWIAIERHTRKIVGLAFGDRSAKTCRELWQSLPADYRKRALLYTDEWNAYQSVLPSKRHRPVPKGSGHTNHIERLNNTLRQWCANLVRKALSFSKNLELHKTRIRMVIDYCNARTDLWAAA